MLKFQLLTRHAHFKSVKGHHKQSGVPQALGGDLVPNSFVLILVTLETAKVGPRTLETQEGAFQSVGSSWPGEEARSQLH